MTESVPLTRGTYTFLFTDIEGSTSLESRVGRDRYGSLLDRHRTILRDVWAAHAGMEQGTEGDSFFVVFLEAWNAVEAAVAAQRALTAEPWPDDAPIRVRMGLHSGGAEMAGDSYVGSLREPRGPHRRRRPRRPGPGIGLDPRPARGPPDRRRDAARPRRASAQGPERPGPHHRGRRRRAADRVPAPPHARQPTEQPADAADDLHRARCRARGVGGTPGDDPIVDPDRAGRDGQDPAVAPARSPGRRRVPRWRLLRPARADPRPDAGRTADRQCGRGQRDERPPDRRVAGRLAARQAAAPRPRQLRAGRVGRADRRRAAPDGPGHQGRRHQPGRPPRLG